MWLKVTWILFLVYLVAPEAVAQNQKDIEVIQTPITSRPVEPCADFRFTCTVLSNTELDPNGHHVLVLYLQNSRNDIQHDCASDIKLNDNKWGAGVYTIHLNDNLTYNKTEDIGGDGKTINAGIIHMSHTGQNFTFTIYKVRKQPGSNLCFTCRAEVMIKGDTPGERKVAHKTVELTVNKEGDDKDCTSHPDKCDRITIDPLKHSQETQGFKYQRNITSTECTNCTCKDICLQEQEVQEQRITKNQPNSIFTCVPPFTCPTSKPPATTTISDATTESTAAVATTSGAGATTTEKPEAGFPVLVLVVLVVLIGCASLSAVYCYVKRRKPKPTGEILNEVPQTREDTMKSRRKSTFDDKKQSSSSEDKTKSSSSGDKSKSTSSGNKTSSSSDDKTKSSSSDDKTKSSSSDDKKNATSSSDSTWTVPTSEGRKNASSHEKKKNEVLIENENNSPSPKYRKKARSFKDITIVSWSKMNKK